MIDKKCQWESPEHADNLTVLPACSKHPAIKFLIQAMKITYQAFDLLISLYFLWCTRLSLQYTLRSSPRTWRWSWTQCPGCPPSPRTWRWFWAQCPGCPPPPGHEDGFEPSVHVPPPPPPRTWRWSWAQCPGCPPPPPPGHEDDFEPSVQGAPPPPPDMKMVLSPVSRVRPPNPPTPDMKMVLSPVSRVPPPPPRSWRWSWAQCPGCPPPPPRSWRWSWAQCPGCSLTPPPHPGHEDGLEPSVQGAPPPPPPQSWRWSRVPPPRTWAQCPGCSSSPPPPTHTHKHTCKTLWMTLCLVSRVLS